MFSADYYSMLFVTQNISNKFNDLLFIILNTFIIFALFRENKAFFKQT